ncbi:hypothetical protein MKY25_13340 [Geobacillus sp. FSL W8-0032]|uniref:DAGKc domain-containing protein n=2 Tax=Geobacillus TaxID=129337 RepID=A0A679FRU5_9BACL|nr:MULTISPECIES: hypothetical protein [Geobacillus]KYD26432.1 hypothetical protein B4113_1013 [Geobacillus sp. B4113_201601]MEB3749291.1 hypothetical protein [Geobacillus icigianus]BBW96977.1 hypothetical protein GsuE55_18100 [Geobacillus subterraneus]
MKLRFIINPAAQNGRSVSIWKQLQPQLNREGIAYQAYWTSRKGEEREKGPKGQKTSKERKTVRPRSLFGNG